MSNPTKIMSLNAVREAAPSVFAEHKHKSRGDNYGFVPTVDVVRRLMKADYVPVAASQSRVRKANANRANFTKHMLRFQHRKHAEAERVVGGMVPEIILINSHDGSSSFQMEAGLFRFVCTNGLVVRDTDFGSIRIQHSGKIAERVVEGADSILEFAPKIIAVTKEWDRIKLTPRQRTNLANAALKLRYADIERSPLTAADVLTARRNDDEAPTLWRTLNVLQENLSQGGQQGRTRTGRTTTVRSIKSVNNVLNFNRGLWSLAEAIAKRA